MTKAWKDIGTQTDDCPPIVHLNGTSKQSLMDGYRVTLHALREARDMLALISPHMRDFYVHPDVSAHARAMHAHQRRLRAIEASIREIEALAEAVDDQDTERDRIAAARIRAMEAQADAQREARDRARDGKPLPTDPESQS